MTEPEIRRASDPRVVRKIHSAIKKTCEQKQCPIFDRILRALSIDKVQISRSKLEIQLKHAIKDGLVIENSGNRGKGFGESKTSYRVPSLENFYEVYLSISPNVSIFSLFLICLFTFTVSRN